MAIESFARALEKQSRLNLFLCSLNTLNANIVHYNKQSCLAIVQIAVIKAQFFNYCSCHWVFMRSFFYLFSFSILFVHFVIVSSRFTKMYFVGLLVLSLISIVFAKKPSNRKLTMPD